MHSCSTTETAKAEEFLEGFLFQESGCYTLFGDKPITSMLIFRGKMEDSSLEDLSSEALKTLAFVDYKTAENFEAWKKVSKKLHMHNFFFVDIPLQNDPTCSSVYFVNIEETKKVFEEYFDLFHAKLKISNWEILLHELKKPNENLWNVLFSDHYLAGLLYGFGQENIETFCRKDKNRIFSESFEDVASKRNFPIPIYAISKKDKTSSKYREQREKIKKKYKSKRILEVTLQTLEK